VPFWRDHAGRRISSFDDAFGALIGQDCRELPAGSDVMNWSKAASTICNTAQFLGGLSSGPVGLSVTAAAIFLSQVLGVPDHRKSILPALQDPNVPENESEAHSANLVELEQLTVTAETRLAHESMGPTQFVGSIMMDWSRVASTIGPTAPLLAELVGGTIEPGVTAASSILSHVLGTSNDPLQVETALTDPAALERVRLAESAISVPLQRLAVTAAQAQLAHEFEVARVESEDREDARAMDMATRDWVPKALAMAVTGAFFGILLLMVLHEMPQENRDLMNIIMGSLGTAWISIIGYYFGTSAGSARKSELMAKTSVPVVPDRLLPPREHVPTTSSPPAPDLEGHMFVLRPRAVPHLARRVSATRALSDRNPRRTRLCHTVHA
jgi:hypothetical protein